MSAEADADLIAARVLDLFTEAPQAARLRFLRDLMASTGRTLPEAAKAAPEPVMTIQQASRRLGLESDRLVYRLFSRGELAGYSVGSRKLVYAASVEAYIAAHSNTKPGEPSTTPPASTPVPPSRPTRRHRRSSSAEPFEFFPPPNRGR